MIFYYENFHCVLSYQLSLKVKVHFVNGCGDVVDRVLCAAIEKLEDHEIEVINLRDEYQPNPSICVR